MSFLTYYSILYSDGRTIERCNEDDRLRLILEEEGITIVDLPKVETLITS